jgi:hypothetical protein
MLHKILLYLERIYTLLQRLEHAENSFNEHTCSFEFTNGRSLKIGSDVREVLLLPSEAIQAIVLFDQFWSVELNSYYSAGHCFPLDCTAISTNQLGQWFLTLCDPFEPGSHLQELEVRIRHRHPHCHYQVIRIRLDLP